MKKVVLAIVALFSFTSCSKMALQSAILFKELEVNVVAHKLTTYSTIQNSEYLVVLETGLGDDHTIWGKEISTQIGNKSDIVIYDRAGYGKSEKGSEPRNIAKLSGELEFVVNQFSHNRKVILVGHSLGGMIIRDYAIKNPTKIAGLLFIDPSHENYNQPTQMQENLVKLLVGFGNAGARNEAKQLIEDAEYMATLSHLPNVPVVVLTSMKQDETNTKADKAYSKTRHDWYKSHELLKSGVADFTHISTTNSGHYIFVEEPKLVLDNLNLLISKLP